MSALFYISFASLKDGFLGGTVVEANDSAGALREATRLGLNPGGEAQIIRVPDDNVGNPSIIALRNRLADRNELMTQRGGYVGVRHPRGEFVCDDCNNPYGEGDPAETEGT
jgi:hypothetical protein